jgi:hypothetical protein
MDLMASHISHVAFSSASDAFVDGTVLDPGERIGVDGEADDKDGEGVVLSHGMPEAERGGEVAWKMEGS